MVAVALMAPACGRFGDADDAAQPSTERVGDAALFETVSSTTSHPSESASTSVATTPALGSVDSTPRSTIAANRSDRADAGWSVTVVVGEQASYAATDEFPIEVTVRNDSGRRGYALIAQDGPAIFAVAGTRDVVWSARDCNRTLTVPELSGGTRIVEAGESLRVVTHYPMSEECSLPPGSYEGYGQFELCDPEQAEETENPGTYVCPDDGSFAVWAGPVAFDLT